MLLFSFFLNIFLCQGYELSGEIALKNNHYYYYYYYFHYIPKDNLTFVRDQCLVSDNDVINMFNGVNSIKEVYWLKKLHNNTRCLQRAELVFMLVSHGFLVSHRCKHSHP